MKLLIVTGIFPPDRGGPASYVPRIAAALAARGHRVRVICLSDRLDHDDRPHRYADGPHLNNGPDGGATFHHWAGGDSTFLDRPADHRPAARRKLRRGEAGGAAAVRDAADFPAGERHQSRQ